MASYRDLIASGRPVLTDAATGTRLRLETGLALDPVLDIASLATGRSAVALAAVAGEYAAIASAIGLPIQLDTMTYWASPDHLQQAECPADLAQLNAACVAAVGSIRRPGSTYLAGVVGPRADGYRPTGSMSAAEAASYHRPQCEALAASGVDLLLASTMSTIEESFGLSAAMAATGVPYVVAMVLTARGTLPDGTPLDEMVRRIDDTVDPAPVHFLLSCTHPSTALDGLRHLRSSGVEVGSRVIGIKANGSAAHADVLEGTQVVMSDTALPWVKQMMTLHDEFGFRMLGGCCGTDGRHLLALALRLAQFC